jgi:Fur family ferric uptake transcriptional regulator
MQGRGALQEGSTVLTKVQCKSQRDGPGAGHGIRMTRQRKVILETLREMATHPSAEEVYEVVRRQLPRISLGTVYRNLEVLSELGKIQKLELGGTIKRFDWNTKKHYHIRCINCDRVDDAPMGFMDNVETALDDTTGYQITGHRLEFLGLCPHCLEQAIERRSLTHSQDTGLPGADDPPEDPPVPKASSF